MRYRHVADPSYEVEAERIEARTRVVWDRDAGYGNTVVLAGEWAVRTAEGPVLAVDDQTFHRCYRPIRPAGDRDVRPRFTAPTRPRSRRRSGRASG
jgi:hypothetical protein